MEFWHPTTASLILIQLFRETLALCYLLLRLGWLRYKPGPGEPALLNGPQYGWEKYEGVLREWLLVGSA